MWKFLDFSAFQKLYEVNFGHFEAPKTAILTILAALNFEFLDIFDIFMCEFVKKSEFKASKMVRMALFDHLKSVKINFT